MIFIVMDLFLFKSFVDCLILKKCELEMLALFRVDLWFWFWFWFVFHNSTILVLLVGNRRCTWECSEFGNWKRWSFRGQGEESLTLEAKNGPNIVQPDISWFFRYDREHFLVMIGKVYNSYDTRETENKCKHISNSFQRIWSMEW
jgi:hypothetical protein